MEDVINQPEIKVINKYLGFHQLEYLGDNSTNECGRCDVCLITKKKSKYTNQDVIDGILYMLSNKSRIVQDFIETLSFPKDDIIKILSQLVDEGFVQITEKGLYEKKWIWNSNSLLLLY